jgi:hypothetical protein
MSLEFVDGIYQAFETLPLGKDAVLYFRPPTAVILIDWEYQYRPDLQARFRKALIQQFERIARNSRWALKGGILRLDTSLVVLGISQTQIKQANGIIGLPAPDENRRIGDLDISTGSDWLKYLDIRR